MIRFSCGWCAGWAGAVVFGWVAVMPNMSLDDPSRLVITSISSHDGKALYHCKAGVFQSSTETFKIGDTVWIKK